MPERSKQLKGKGDDDSMAGSQGLREGPSVETAGPLCGDITNRKRSEPSGLAFPRTELCGGSIIEKGLYLIGSTDDIPLPLMGQISAIPIASRLCDTVGGVMAAPRWGHASTPCPRRGRDYLRRMSAAHTEPNLVAAVTLC